MTRHFIYFQW